MSLVGIVKWIPFLLIALSPFPWQISCEPPPSWQTNSPITLDNFNMIFNTTPNPNGPGGCGSGRTLGEFTKFWSGTRTSLMAVNDALNMTKGASEQLGYDGVDAKDKGKTIRQLLYLFFGLRVNSYSGTVEIDDLHEYQYVRENINDVVWFLTQKTPPPYPTNWYCDDDWLMYTKNAVGPDGKENPNPPLAAEVENWKNSTHVSDSIVKNGQYFPGLLWDTLRGTGYYSPLEKDPYHRVCKARSNGRNFVNGYVTSYYHKDSPTRKGWNLSLCRSAFSTSPVGYNGEPGSGTKTAPEMLPIYWRSISVTATHEIFHVVSNLVIIDQPEVVPPNNDWSAIKKEKLPYDVTQMGWTQNKENNTYGPTMSAWLGLAMPSLAQKSAENYAGFVLCLRYPTLNCVGTFGININKRESVPFTVPSRVSQRLRNRGSVFDEEDFDAELEALGMEEHDGRDIRFSS